MTSVEIARRLREIRGEVRTMAESADVRGVQITLQRLSRRVGDALEDVAIFESAAQRRTEADNAPR